MISATRLMRKLMSMTTTLSLGLGMPILVLLFFLADPVLLHQVDLKLYDLYLARQAGGKVTTPVVIVDIDEPSLQRYGQWPWPRYRLAAVIEQLTQAGAAAVAFDIVLAERDRTSPDAIVEALRNELGIEARYEGIPPELRDNDVLLAQLLAQTPVVLGAFVRFDEEATLDTTLGELKYIERLRPGGIPALPLISQGRGMLAPEERLRHAADIAFFNVALDQDGIVRRVPLVMRIGDKLYPGLSLRALMKAFGEDSVRLTSGPEGLERIGVSSLNLPVAPDGTMLVPYLGPAGTFPYISVASVLEGEFDPRAVQGKIVLVGTSATGLQDIRSTPLDRYTPGVEVHATVLDAAMNERSLLIPAWNTGLQALIIMGLGLLSLFLFGWGRPSLVLIGGAGLLAGCWWGGMRFFATGLYVSPLWGMLSIAASGLSLGALRLLRAERDKSRIRNVFSRYVSPDVVADIVERGQAVLKGESRELSVLFADIRGFTSLAEHLPPEHVVEVLNTYFTPLTALVRASHGTLDKFMGDALMAFWNAPLDVPQHQIRAINTVFDMFRSLDAINARLNERFGITLNMGVGLHTGLAHVGNMGSKDLTSYTAIGDTINLAARLEGICALYSIKLAMTQSMVAYCPEKYTRLPIARLKVKGRREAIQVWTAIHHDEALARHEELMLYRQAYDAYTTAIRERSAPRLLQALSLFESLEAQFDSPLHAEYLRQCTLLLTRPMDSWSDVWILADK